MRVYEWYVVALTLGALGSQGAWALEAEVPPEAPPERLCRWDITLRHEQNGYQSNALIEGPLGAAGLEAAFGERQVLAGEPTGDFVRVGHGTDGRIAILFGDVEGHGTLAAPTVLLLHAYLDAHPWEAHIDATTTPPDVLLDIDAHLPPRHRAVTMSVVLYDPRDGSLQYASASVPPARVMDAAGNIASLPGDGFFLGAIDDAYSYRSTPRHTTRHRLAPGGYIALLSDGVYDSTVASGERLRRTVDTELSTRARRSESPRQIVDGVLGAIARVRDDSTVLVLRRPAP